MTPRAAIDPDQSCKADDIPDQVTSRPCILSIGIACEVSSSATSCSTRAVVALHLRCDETKNIFTLATFGNCNHRDIALFVRWGRGVFDRKGQTSNCRSRRLPSPDKSGEAVGMCIRAGEIVEFEGLTKYD